MTDPLDQGFPNQEQPTVRPVAGGHATSSLSGAVGRYVDWLKEFIDFLHRYIDAIDQVLIDRARAMTPAQLQDMLATLPPEQRERHITLLRANGIDPDQ